MNSDYYGFNGEELHNDKNYDSYDDEENRKIKLSKFIFIFLGLILLILIIFFLVRACTKSNSNDIQLSSITTSAGYLSPKFSKDNKIYTLLIPTDIVTIDCASQNKNVTIKGCNESIKITKDSLYVHRITVTNKDGNSQVYTLKIKYSEVDTNSYIQQINGIPVEYTSKDITVSVVLNDSFKYDSKPYSFDGGNTWQSNNYIVVSENKTINLYVKDSEGHLSNLKEIIIDKIDKVVPVVSIKSSIASNSLSNSNITLMASVNPKENISGYTYQWYKDKKLINGANSSSYIATQSGSYTVKVTTGSGISTLSNEYIAKIDKNVMDNDKESIPIINSVTGNVNNWTKEDVVLTINASSSVGLHDYPYSFDGGNTWQKNNSKEFKTNQTVVIKVRDKNGNISSTNTQKITKIDKEGPTIKIIPSTTSLTTGTVDLTVIANDVDSKVAVNGYSWTNATSGFGTVMTKRVTENGTYTIWVKDNAGNVSSLSYAVLCIIREELSIPVISGGNLIWTNNSVVLNIVSPSISSLGYKVSNYEYYISKSGTSLIGGSWININDTSINITKEGLNYIFVRGKSNDGKTFSLISEPVVTKIDKTPPTAKVNIYEKVTESGNIYYLKLVGTDNLSKNLTYSWYDSSSNQLINNYCVTANQKGYFPYQIKDEAGNTLTSEAYLNPNLSYVQYNGECD